MSAEQLITVRLAQWRDYQFDVDFGAAVPTLRADEPPPLGRGEGPSPIQLLAAAVGNCLADSVLFALRKYKQHPEPIGCDVTAEVGRNAEGRLRVLAVDAKLTLGKPAAELQHLDRVLGSFETYCTVTQSIGQGIDIRVRMFDAAGVQVK